MLARDLWLPHLGSKHPVGGAGSERPVCPRQHYLLLGLVLATMILLSACVKHDLRKRKRCCNSLEVINLPRWKGFCGYKNFISVAGVAAWIKIRVYGVWWRKCLVWGYYTGWLLFVDGKVSSQSTAGGVCLLREGELPKNGRWILFAERRCPLYVQQVTVICYDKVP